MSKMRNDPWLHTLVACLLALALIASIAPAALASEEETVPELPEGRPGILILDPAENQGVGEGNLLDIVIQGAMLARIEVIASWNGGSESMDFEGESLVTTMELPPIPGEITLIARGFSVPDASGNETIVETKRTVLSPKQAMIEDMIDLAYKNSKDRRYKFAPAQEDSDIGVCKNFVMRLFNTFKDGYYMLEYPDLELHMPLNRRLVDCKPYQYGIEWALEEPADGAPFEIAGKFRYDNELSKEENQALAREFLMQVKRGDFYQMVGNYVDGNGPHSLLMIADYDPEKDLLRWTDSNMKGKRIDGVRWGYLMFDTQRTVDWMVKAICTRNRGATIYRLRDDLVRK